MGITQQEKDEHFMRLALEQARIAQANDEVPVGAVIVKNDEVIATGFNQVINKNDPSAHAEIVAIRNAGEQLNNYRLVDCDLYVTLEPCGMCAGSLIHARIKRLVIGAFDKKTGSVSSVDQVFDKKHQNHQVSVTSNVLSEECGQILSHFFKNKRKNKTSMHCE